MAETPEMSSLAGAVGRHDTLDAPIQYGVAESGARGRTLTVAHAFHASARLSRRNQAMKAR